LWLAKSFSQRILKTFPDINHNLIWPPEIDNGNKPTTSGPAFSISRIVPGKHMYIIIGSPEPHNEKHNRKNNDQNIYNWYDLPEGIAYFKRLHIDVSKRIGLYISQ
jgi:hypothetical protein